MYFFFNDTATTEIYTLSLHDALPISYNISFNPSPSGVNASGTSGSNSNGITSFALASASSRVSSSAFAFFAASIANKLSTSCSLALTIGSGGFNIRASLYASFAGCQEDMPVRLSPKAMFLL